MKPAAIRVRVTREPAGGCRFALDPQVFRQDASEGLLLSGWVVHPEFRLLRVTIGQEGRAIASADLEVHRPRAHQEYGGFPGSDRTGFELIVPGLQQGTYWLNAETESGRSLRIAKLLLAEEGQPKLLFMHIAKAAGSTVNSYFASHFARGNFLVHIESDRRWRADPASLQKFHFLSGHVGFQALRRRMDLGQFRVVTVVREPYQQLISHLAWIRRLSDPSEEARLLRHPEYVQAFSKKLAGHDLSKAREIDSLINSLSDPERQLVDNCQVRYFAQVEAGCEVGDADLQLARFATEHFDHIGLAEDLGSFFAKIAEDMGWPPPEAVASENVTRDFYGLEHAGIRIRRALKPLVRYDIQLYDFIRRKRHT
jgi:hypothetical protein